MRNRTALRLCMVVLLVASSVPESRASDGKDLDAYKIRITGSWWLANPSGSFHSSGNQGSFDLQRDFGFSNYSTFSGKIDYRFARKHHLTFGVSPLYNSKSTTLARTVEFQGQTYAVGAKASADIRSLLFAPGYQYDILRRNRGYLAIVTEMNFIDTKATITGEATVTAPGGGTTTAIKSASGSVLAPLPVVGMGFRWYPSRDSGRIALDGRADGMYFFGYGSFWSANGAMSYGLSQHWKLRGGYQVGTRLKITGSSDQIGLRLTQKGPLVGVEASW